jgi:ribosome-interacting GTPase 1
VRRLSWNDHHIDRWRVSPMTPYALSPAACSGTLHFRGAKIQVVDLPGIIEGPRTARAAVGRLV